MKLDLAENEPKITLTDASGLKKDVTYDSVLLIGALVAMYHEGAITVMGQDGEPIFDMTVQYHQKQKT